MAYTVQLNAIISATNSSDHFTILSSFLHNSLLQKQVKETLHQLITVVMKILLNVSERKIPRRFFRY